MRENKEERYKLMLDAQKERMECDRKRAEKKLEIEREKIELEKQQAAIKWELEKAKTFGDIELQKEVATRRGRGRCEDHVGGRDPL